MIDSALVEKVAALYGTEREHSDCAEKLREAFPELRITLCSDDELGNAKPVLEKDTFNIYLYGGDHCLTLTNHFEGASGIVIAEVESDEE